jgi:hypothetical protein
MKFLFHLQKQKKNLIFVLTYLFTFVVVQAWAAILRHQIASFFAYKSSVQPFDVEISALVSHIVSEILDGQLENTDITDRKPVIDECNQICERVWKYPI